LLAPACRYVSTHNLCIDNNFCFARWNPEVNHTSRILKKVGSFDVTNSEWNSNRLISLEYVTAWKTFEPIKIPSWPQNLCLGFRRRWRTVSKLKESANFEEWSVESNIGLNKIASSARNDINKHTKCCEVATRNSEIFQSCINTDCCLLNMNYRNPYRHRPELYLKILYVPNSKHTHLRYKHRSYIAVQQWCKTCGRRTAYLSTKLCLKPTRILEHI
jgi:hypothetical protein